MSFFNTSNPLEFISRNSLIAICICLGLTSSTLLANNPSGEKDTKPSVISTGYDDSVARTKSDLISIDNNDCDENLCAFGNHETAAMSADALDFDGAGDYISVPNSTSLENYVTTGELTIEFWLNLSNLDSPATIISKRNSSNNAGFIFESSGSNIVPLVRFGNSWGVVPFTPTFNQWQHVAVVAEENVGVSTYIDGVLIGFQSTTGTFSGSGAAMTIGEEQQTSSNRFLDGQLDEIRIWSVARSCSEINSFMNCELTGAESGLEAYYQFNQGTDGGTNTGETTLNDLTTNNNDGTLLGFALSGTTSNWIAPGGVTTGNSCSGLVGPIMDVQGNSVSITNGDTTPDAGDDTDFGDVSISSNKPITYTIENTGTTNLTLDGSPIIAISGTNASEFVVISQATSPVTSGGGTTTFTIEFTPTATGIRSAMVTIENDDCANDPYTFDIQGTGVNPAATIDFDGTNDYVVVPQSSNFNISSGSFTLECWVKSNTSGFSGLISKRDFSTSANQYGLTTESSGKIQFVIGNGSLKSINSDDPINDNTWHHVAAVKDGTKMLLFVDGVLQSDMDTFSGNGDNTLDLVIGRYYTTNDLYYIDGAIDEVRVWSTARTCDEINYFKDCELAGTESGLVAYYQFNQGINGGANTGETTLTDLTSNGNDGTLTNFALTGNSSNWIAPGGVTTGNSCSGAPTSPVIVLEGNNSEIPSGDTTPSTTDDTDFGDIVINSTHDHIFTIKNTGDTTLNLTGSPIVDISGDGEFTIETQPSADSIASGGADLSFVVRYSPTAAATHTATISIASDDCDEDPYEFGIMGTGVLLNVTNTNDSGTGSLREMITFANANPGSTITFSVDGILTPLTALPTITSDMTINGTTAPGYAAGAPSFIIRRPTGGTNFSYSLIASGVTNLTITGLSISSTSIDGHGISITNCNNVTIADNSVNNRHLGIFVSGGSNVTITNNDLQDTGTGETSPAISLSNVTLPLAVSNNTFGGSGNTALRVENMSNISVGSTTGDITLEDNKGLNDIGNTTVLSFDNCSNIAIDDINVSRPVGLRTGTAIKMSNCTGTNSVTNCDLDYRNGCVTTTGAADLTITGNSAVGSGDNDPLACFNLNNLNSIVMNTNTFGSGGRTVLNLSNMSNISIGSTTGDIVFEDNIGFNDIGVGSRSILYFDACSNIAIDDVDLSHSPSSQIGTGIRMNNCTGTNSVTNCDIEYRQEAVHTTGAANLTLTSNNVMNSGQSEALGCFHLNGLNSIAMSNNTFGGSGNTALRVENMSNISVGSTTGDIILEDNKGLNDIGNTTVLSFDNCSNITIDDINVSRPVGLRTGTAIKMSNCTGTNSVMNCDLDYRNGCVTTTGAADLTITGNSAVGSGDNDPAACFNLNNLNSIVMNTNTFGSGGRTVLNLSNMSNISIGSTSGDIVFEDNIGFNEIGVGSRSILYFNACSNIAIDDVDLSHSASSQSGTGIRMNNCTGSNSVTNCDIEYRQEAVHTTGAANLTLTSNNVMNSGQSETLGCFHLNGLNSIVMSSNTFGGSTVTALQLENMDDVIIGDENVSNTNIEIADGSGFTAIGNGTSSIISLSNCTNSTIDNIDLNGNGAGAGFTISGGSGNIAQNVYVGNRLLGGKLISGSSNTITCNTFTILGEGMEISGSPSGNVIDNNTFICISSFAIDNNTGSSITAENNFWSSSDGPSNDGGSGSTYEGTIDAIPFLTAPDACAPVSNLNEINILGNAISIDNGATTPDVADDTDFGAIAINTTHDHTFTIKNTGNATLNLSGNPIVAISGDSEFTVETQPSASTIASGGADLTFVVRYAPTAVATHTATISIANDDCDEDPYEFTVTGTGGDAAAALNFDGSNDVAECGDIDALDAVSTFTLELWVNFDAIGGNVGLIGKGTDSQNRIAIQSFSSNTLFFVLNDGNGSGDLSQPSFNPGWSPNIWYHVAMVYDGTQTGNENKLKVYFDGVQQVLNFSGTVPTMTNDNAAELLIGRANGLGTIDGQIDEVRVWTSARTCEEINHFKDCELTGTESDLEAYYKFNQGIASGTNSGETTLNDQTANNNNGVITNFALIGSTSNWIAPGSVTSGSSCSGSAPGPEITVNEVAVGTDFGNVNLNSTSTFSYTITNIGTTDLTIFDITSDNSEFTIENFTANSTAGSGGGTVTFDVDFSPTIIGLQSALISIDNDDCDEDLYTFNIQGTGFGSPEIDVLGNGMAIANGDATPDVLDDTNFGSLCNGESTSKTFTINNTGTLDLNISSITADNADYTISGVPSVVGPSSSETFTVSFAANVNGTQTATITINNNDTDENPFTFDVSTEVNALPIADLSPTETIICTGEEVTFTATGGTMYEFFLNGMSQGAASTTATFASTTLANSDVVSVTITDANGCMNTHAGITMTVNPNPTAGLSADMTTICAGEEVTFTASGGTMFEFFVNGMSQGASSATTTFASTTLADSDVVSVTVADANGCSDTHSGITITVNENPVYTSVTVNCTGGTLDDVVVNATIGSGTLEYSVDGGTYQASNTFTGLSQGNHTFDIRETTTLCSVSSGVQMISCSCPTISMNTISADQTICVGESTTILDGAIAVTTPVTPFNYQWQSSPTGANTFTNIATATNDDYDAGSPSTSMDYRRLVMVSGCPDDISNIITITVNPNPTAGLSADMTTICAGEEVTFTATGGTMYEFFLNGMSQGAASTTATFASTTLANSDVVSVTITDANGCMNTHAGITMTVNPNPTAGLSVDMTTICAGEEVTFTASGGTMFEFFVNGMSQGASSATTTFASTTLADSDVVSVTVADANGCSDTHSGITITVNENPVYTSVTVNCTGGTLDDVVVNATIGSGTLEYSVDGGTYQASNTFTGLSQGNHTFDIRETTTLCSVNSGVQMISCSCPTISMNTISADQTICVGESTTILDGATAVTTPVTAFDYQWQSSPAGANTFTNIATATNEDYDAGSPSTSTDYRRLVMVSGCPDDISNIITITVNPNPTAGLSADMSTICAGEEVTFTATGGTMYEFFLNGMSQGSASATATFASTTLANFDVISVTVTDANGCTDTHSGITMTVNPNPTVGFSVNMTTICAGEEVTFSATGGTMYEFFINGMSQGSASATATFASTALANSDVVTVTVSDANGCTDTHAGIAVNVNENPVYTSVTVNCTGGTLDDVVVNASISSGTLEYNVDGGTYQSSNTFTGLSQGNHTFDIRESTTLCSVSSGVQMISCDCPTITMNTISANQMICAGDPTTMLDGATAVTSPVTPFDYQWQSSPTGANTFTNIASATNEDYNAGSPSASTDYRRLVMVSGCSDDISNITTITVNLNPIAGLSADMTTICSGEEVTFTATGGTMYEFFINGMSQSAASGTATFASTTIANSDVVSVTVTDANGCTDTHSGITMTVNPNPIAGLSADMTTTCVGEEITFTASGGTMYEFFINGSTIQGPSATTTYSTSALIDQDVVTVLVSGSNSCSALSSGITVTINPNPTPIINPSAQELNCSTTTIMLDGSSSMGQGILSYSWSNGSADAAIMISDPGLYLLTITDGNTCSASSSILVSEDITEPTVDINSGGITEISCLQTSINLDASGSSGQGSLSYLWSTGAITSNIDVSIAATYSVTVTDSDNFCTSEASIEITGNTINPTASINSGGINTLTCAQPSITLNASGSSGQGSLSYLWSTGETTASINATMEGNYSVTVTEDFNSCTDVADIDILQDVDLPTIDISSGEITELNCDQMSISLDGSGSSGMGSITYLWSTGETSADISINSPNTYSLTITDTDNGCTAESSIIITQDILSPNALAIPDFTELNCSTASITIDGGGSTGQGGISYLWSTGSTMSTIDVNIPDSYNLTITDSDNGCTDLITVNITEDVLEPIADITSVSTELTCQITNIILDGTNSSGQGSLSYLWSTGETTAIINIISADTYSLTVTDTDNGCSHAANVIITEDIAMPTANITSSTTELNCNTPMIQLDGGTSTGQGTITYLWSTGETTATIDISTPNSYSLTITDSDNNCTSETSLIITQDILTPTTVINASDPSFTCVINSITLDASMSMGQGALSYLWSTGETTANIEVTQVNAYTVTITDADNGCESEETISLSLDNTSPIIAVVPSDSELNCTVTSIILDASSSVGQGTISYLWSTGETTSTIDVSSPDVYGLTITDSQNGCINTTSTAVSQDIIVPDATIISSAIELNCTNTIITLDGSTSSGQGSLTYLWSTGETTASIMVTTDDTYELTITDSDNGCTAVTSQIITENITPPIADISSNSTELTCILTSITLDASNSSGQGMISYLWSTGATTATIAVSNIGIYSLTITDDGNGCTQIDEVTITEDILAPTAAISSSESELNCSIMSISLDASGSIVQGTASYLWSTGETTASINVTTPSNYSVTITDSDNECTDSENVDITENTNDPVANITSGSTELNCDITSITLDAGTSTGQGTLIYLWSTGETTATIDIITAEEFSLTITDAANNCTDETTVIITEDILTPTLVLMPSQSEFNCIVSTINLDASSSSGQGTLAYLWSTGETTSDIDVIAIGGYTVTITDSDNGCTSEETITLGENNTIPTASISSGGISEITCVQDLITLDASGSTGQDALTYLWSTGSTDTTIDITSEGTYTVTITDSANGCEDQTDIIITQDIAAPTAMIQASEDELTCTILTSTLDASGSTGQGTISYVWSTGETTPMITVNAANDYTVTVTDDDNGCTDEISFTLAQDIMGFTAEVIPTATEFTCDVTSIDIDASGSSGQGTLTYLWSTGETSSVITVTLPETYTVTITDSNNGCEIIQGTTLTENILQPTVMSNLSDDELNCTITSISIDASSSTGQGTLTYLWSTGETTNTIDVTAPDDYSVTVTDSANGCSNSSIITVDQNIDTPTVMLASSADNITCDVTEVFLDASGSTSNGTLSYLWSTGETTDLISVSIAGTYMVTVTDDNSTCMEVEMIVVGENIAMPTANISSSGTELNCLDLSLILDASSSTGQGSLSYLWSTGETTSSINVSTAEIFTVTITDTENGCTDETNIAITEDVVQPIANISSPSTIITCTDMALTLDGNGSSGQGTLSYLWSTGETTTTINVNSAGNYELTVTDGDNGCTATTALNITENIVDPIATINSGGVTELSCDQPTITLNASNSTGQGSLSFLWSTGETNAAIDVTMDGTYDLTITDGANGCTNASSITITQNVDLPMADISAPVSELTCNIESIVLDGSGSTTQGMIEFAWSTGETSAAISIMDPNSYVLTITDSANGCTNSATFEVTQNINEPEGALVASATEIDCETSTISLDVSGYIGQGDLSYLWSTGETSASIDVTEANLYVVSITDDANGCIAITSQAITENISMPSAGIDAPITELTCQNTMVTLDGSTSMGQGNLTYLWSTGESGVSIVVDAAGTYGLTVTDDSNGCSQETSVIITQDENVPILNMIPSGTELTCLITDITLDATTSMGQGDLSFLWSTGETATSINIDAAGTYTLTITDDSNGCTSEQSQEIVENITLPTALITSPTSTLSCTDESIVLNGAESTSQGIISYLWSTSETTASIIISDVGIYGLTITDAVNGCIEETSIVIDENITNPVSTISASALELTCTLTSINIDASASSGQGTLMYAWNTGESSEFIDVVSPGDYTVTITDDINGCTSESSVSITQNIEGLNLSLTSTNSELNCNVTSILLDASGTTGFGTLDFLWSTGETTSSISVSTPDMYSVTITDQENGCEVIGEETITEDLAEPIITFTSPESICLNVMPVDINPQPGGGLLTGNGIVGTTFDPSLAGVGSHAIQYSYTGLNGCSKDSTFTIEVLLAPVPNISGEVSYCSGAELMLIEDSGTGNNWTWTGPNGFTAVGQSISISDLQLGDAGMYSVEVINSDGCIAVADVEISLDLSPSIVLDGAMEVCEGEDINISEIGGEGISWTWTGPNGINQSGDQISLMEVDANDSGKYYLEIENVDGCTNVDSFDLTVNPLPSINLTSNGPLCFGEDLNLLETAGQGTIYNWTGPEGFNSTSQDANLTNVSEANSGIYYLAIRDDNSCMNEDSIEIIVHLNPAIEIMSSSPICNGEDLELSEFGEDAVSWTWTDPNGTNYTDQEVVIANANVVLGNYNLEITDINGCTSTLDTMVTSASGEDIETNFLIGAFACVGDTIRFIDYSVIDSTTLVDFYWDFGNGDTSVDRDPLYIYEEGGFYDINLEITNGECPNVSISKSLEIASCRLEEDIFVEVNAFPTISTGSFNVELSSDEDVDMLVQVVSTQGELVYSRYIEDALKQVNLEIDIFHTGIYTLAVRHNYGVEVRRIVVVR